MRAPDDVTSRDPDEHGSVATGRLWAGGLATAVVAALVVVAGVFIARRILGIPVLAPSRFGSFGSSTTVIYAAVAFAGTLLATGLLNVLLLATPNPLSFFCWITALADVIAVAAPFAQAATLPSKVVTAVINLVAGVAVISLLTGVGSSATRPGGRGSRPGPP
jgi:hypothetical protein